jgi:hypothetical protein
MCLGAFDAWVLVPIVLVPRVNSTLGTLSTLSTLSTLAP